MSNGHVRVDARFINDPDGAPMESTVQKDDVRANYASTRNIIQFNVDARFNTSGVSFANANWSLSDYIKNDRDLNVKAYATNGQPCIVLYNSDYSIKSFILADTSDSGIYSKTTTITKDSCAFIRVQSSYGLSLYATVSYRKDVIDGIVKADYTASPIFFTVPVNQSFPNNTDITTSLQDSESFQNVNCALYLPIDYRAIGNPTKIAFCAHGAGGQITSSDAGELAGFTALLNAGYAIFDVNGSNNSYAVEGSQNMGSPRTLSAIRKAFDYIKSMYNVEDKLYVHGHSMGGLTALNFAIQNPEIVKVVGVFHPVTDLYNQAWLSPWFADTKAMLAQEYNFTDQTGTTWEHDKVIGYNPIENHSHFDGTNRYNHFPVPIKIWHGNADTTVSLSGSQALITAMKNAGVRCALRTLDTVAHTRTSTMYTEEVYWFNRF